MKKFLLIGVALMMGLFVSAQKKTSENTLLWRITGKGLTKPSYLYGTMHLTDKRVFQLGDSVIKVLEQTEGFAAELDLDRAGVKMINAWLKSEEEKNSREPAKVKDMVSAETWERYKDLLEKKLYKKADKITIDDLDDIETRLEADIFKKGDMPTFLDAWLYGQAKKQGKWVGGIEDIEDQIEHLDFEDVESKIQLALFDDDYYRGSLDWFIKTYTNQQLDTIDAFMYREVSGSKDYIMIKRNIKMAHRIDSLSAIRSILFAVGAAHLPGDSGVIALLRSRGFTVSPVISSKKIDGSKYKSKAADFPWVQVSVKDSSYALQMPGVSEAIDIYASMGLEIQTYFDLSMMKMYMTIGVEIPEERAKAGPDSLFNSMKDRYAYNSSTSSEKNISVNGIDGREFKFSTDDGEMRMQIFLPNMEKMVMNALFSFTEKALKDQESERFFNSFTYNKDKRRPAPQEKIWTRMDKPLQAFSVEMPVKPKETKDVVSDEGVINYTWQAIDISSQVFYGISVSAMKEGMYDSNDDTTYFMSLQSRITEGLTDGKLIDSSFRNINSYPAYRFSVKGRSEGDHVEMDILSVQRGGLNYYVFAVFESAGDQARQMGKKFINSFRLLPYRHTEWKQVTSPDNSFSTLGPASVKKDEDVSSPDPARFIIYDSTTAVTLYADRIIFPSWFWYSAGDTAYLRQRSLQYSSWNDSIVNYAVSESGDMSIASFDIIRPGDDLVKKVKFILNGNELFELFGYISSQDFVGRFDRFFDNFNVLNKKKRTDKSASKMNELVTAVSKADKEEIEVIKQWWDNLSFSHKDIPALQKLFLKGYPDFDSSFYDILSARIQDELTELDSTHTTVEYIRANYASMKPEDEYIKLILIDYLSGIQTAESFALLKEILIKAPPDLGKTVYFSHSLYDSLKLTASLFPEALQLLSNETLWKTISWVSTSLLDSNLLHRSRLKEYAKHINERVSKELRHDKLYIEENSYSYIDLIRLLGAVNTSESNALLTRFAKFDNREIKFWTLIAMLENNLPVDSRNFITLAMIDEYRHKLYDELKRINKLKLFPATYLKQEALARSKLTIMAMDDEEYRANIMELAGQQTVMYKGKQQKFYLYKVSFDDDYTTFYLGVAGPYSLDAKDLSSSHDATGVYWREEFDKTKLNGLLKDYINMLLEFEDKH